MTDIGLDLDPNCSTLCQSVKQFGPRSGPISVCTIIGFLKDFFEKDYFENVSRQKNITKTIPTGIHRLPYSC